MDPIFLDSAFITILGQSAIKRIKRTFLDKFPSTVFLIFWGSKPCVYVRTETSDESTFLHSTVIEYAYSRKYEKVIEYMIKNKYCTLSQVFQHKWNLAQIDKFITISGEIQDEDLCTTRSYDQTSLELEKYRIAVARAEEERSMFKSFLLNILPKIKIELESASMEYKINKENFFFLSTDFFGDQPNLIDAKKLMMRSKKTLINLRNSLLAGDHGLFVVDSKYQKSLKDFERVYEKLEKCAEWSSDRNLCKQWDQFKAREYTPVFFEEMKIDYMHLYYSFLFRETFDSIKNFKMQVY